MADLSEIQHFFQGSTVFLTGATGYIGKLVLEKLLRGCPGICHIYILIRQKKGKDSSTRLMELFDTPAFDPLKRTYPTFTQKITIMNGDCALPDLGLGEQDKNIIKEDVDVIIHCAATVRFDQKLSQATKINVRATRDLLRIANRMQNLKAMVHVSTAYSNCDRKEIDEVIYPPKIDGHKLIQAVDALDDEFLNEIQTKLLGDLPNTYTLTKQVTEDMVKQEGQTLPVCILRPAVVIATSEEPLSGFIDNYYGPTGLFLGGALGILRNLLGNRKCKADLVPGDFVVNHILAAAWYIGNKRISREPKDPEVLNLVSTVQSPITWGDYLEFMKEHGPDYATEHVVMYPYVVFQPNPYIFAVLEVLLHTIPAYIVDFLCICIGRKPMLREAYKKISYAGYIISYFPMHEWIFHDDRTRNMFNKMSIEDKKLFNFDIKSLNWSEYLLSYLKGMRVYILKDPLNTVEAGKKHFRKLKYIHYSIVGLLTVILYYILWLLYTLVF